MVPPQEIFPGFTFSFVLLDSFVLLSPTRPKKYFIVSLVGISVSSPTTGAVPRPCMPMYLSIHKTELGACHLHCVSKRINVASPRRKRSEKLKLFPRGEKEKLKIAPQIQI